MKTFNQLIITEKGEVTETEKDFLETHQAIMQAGSIITEFAVKLAVNLKTMRDNKLYAAAGFATFADYTEQAIGLKERQAYKYIKVLEVYGEDFLHSNAKTVGITKLELLAGLTNDDREKIESKGKVEDVSVSELKRQIEVLKQEKANLFKQLEFDVADEKSKITEELVNDHKKSISKLQAQLEETQAELEQAHGELEQKNTEAGDDYSKGLEKEIEELTDQLNTLKAKPVAKEIVKEVVKDEKTAAELATAKEQLAAREILINEKEQELLKAKKQLENTSDQALVKFKIRFEEFQGLAKELMTCLAALDESKQEKCKQALKTVIGGLAI